MTRAIRGLTYLVNNASVPQVKNSTSTTDTQELSDKLTKSLSNMED